MSTRTTVTLDEDVAERVKEESRTRGVSFRETLNELLRAGLIAAENQPKGRRFYLEPHHGGYYLGLNYDCTEALLELAEGLNQR